MVRPLLGDAPREPDARSVEEAARKLEAVLLRQLIASSGVFKGGDVAGGQIRSDMFVEALSEAVANGGGIGIARMLERSLESRDAGEAGEPAGAGRFAGPSGLGHPGGARGAPTPDGPGERPTSTPLRGTPAAMPLVGPITSGFGRRTDPIEGDVRFHAGLDFAAPAGTPVHAVLPGVVKSVGTRGGYGQTVEVDHGGGLTTLYAHNSQLLVQPGQKIERGEELALSGATGRATGAHLHLEVRKEGRAIDPQRALNAYGLRDDAKVAGVLHSPGHGGKP